MNQQIWVFLPWRVIKQKNKFVCSFFGRIYSPPICLWFYLTFITSFNSLQYKKNRSIFDWFSYLNQFFVQKKDWKQVMLMYVYFWCRHYLNEKMKVYLMALFSLANSKTSQTFFSFILNAAIPYKKCTENCKKVCKKISSFHWTTYSV